MKVRVMLSRLIKLCQFSSSLKSLSVDLSQCIVDEVKIIALIVYEKLCKSMKQSKILNL
ncbi:hypothetical protein I4U23_005006 [Adineta vaga]|nr:hypothetical protein I4U23_005006 [Adineta vaga]